MPSEVLARLRELSWPTHWLRGNADRAVVMGYDGTIPAELLEHPLFQGDALAATFITRAERDFGLRTTPVDEWIGTTVDWYRQNPPEKDSAGYDRRPQEIELAQWWRAQTAELERQGMERAAQGE